MVVEPGGEDDDRAAEHERARDLEVEDRDAGEERDDDWAEGKGSWSARRPLGLRAKCGELCLLAMLVAKPFMMLSEYLTTIAVTSPPST